MGRWELTPYDCIQLLSAARRAATTERPGMPFGEGHH
jgi:hypothetical protein